MATKEQGPNTGQPDDSSKNSEGGTSSTGTFETDISETGEDGTTVRQSEVSEKDLTEAKPSSDEGGMKDAGKGP
ncbi:hypothetical protein KZJ38_11585 [Paraburkholderia edwinii]|jgi:hypothetical protein|uniref:Uncharacterized protein n=1 Tax=Paraburkholderia edwinii TaxID=2861782 RepID=A0ABX8UEP6_9BURK|nr:hypothetical protein [Paraburkholderia edwinii]QYD67054.1 hypothetical protein KZJ38_11585 [Paraburkholderia edwinii]